MAMIMRKALWEQPAPVPLQKEDEPQLAEVITQRTREFLATKDWCLWKCSTLGGGIIAVLSGENVKGVPEGYPVYMEAELEELCQNDISEVTLRLVHEAKKIAGAVVISIEDGEEANSGIK